MIVKYTLFPKYTNKKNNYSVLKFQNEIWNQGEILFNTIINFDMQIETLHKQIVHINEQMHNS